MIAEIVSIFFSLPMKFYLISLPIKFYLLNFCLENIFCAKTSIFGSIFNYTAFITRYMFMSHKVMATYILLRCHKLRLSFVKFEKS